MYPIIDLTCRAGRIGLAAMPGRGGDYAGDLAAIRAWAPNLVISMTPDDDLARHGAASFGADLAAAGIRWRQVATEDYGVPGAAVAPVWALVARDAARTLDAGGGCSRIASQAAGARGWRSCASWSRRARRRGWRSHGYAPRAPARSSGPRNTTGPSSPGSLKEGERPGTTQADPVAAASFRT